MGAWCNITFGDGTGGGSNTTNPLSYAGNLYLNGELATNIVIPDTVTYIRYYAFSGCTSLTSVTISNNVTTIGKEAFRDCYNLTNVTIGSGVTSIGSNAFRDCYKLVEVYNLSSLTITAGSTDNGYVGCYAKNVYTTESSSNNFISQDNYTFYNNNGTYYLIGYTGSDTELTLPALTVNGSTVSYIINTYAFCDNTKITSITIPDSVTYIGAYAFEGCTALTSVTFENADGWYVSISSTATEGTELTLTDASTNATYLKNTYYNYYWFRTTTEE